MRTIDTSNEKGGRYKELLKYAKTLGFRNVSEAISAYGKKEFMGAFKAIEK